MNVGTYKKRIVLIIIASVLCALVCCACGNALPSDSGNVLPNEENSTTYSVSYSCSIGGAIDGKSIQHVMLGESAETVTAIPNDGFEFIEWTDGLTDPTRTDEDIRSDFTVAAKFKKKNYNITYTTDGNGVLQGVAEQTVKYGNSATAVTAIPNDGYEFEKWSDGVTTATRQDDNVHADIIVSAIFGNKKYSVMYVTDGNGKIQGVAHQRVEQGQTATAVTAIPNDGYEFEKWSDGVNTATRLDDGIFSELTVKAEFRKKTYYKLQYLVYGDGGSIQGDTIQYVEPGESGSTVMAVPDEGYEFWYWSELEFSDEAERTDANITHDITIYASFLRKKVQVEYKGANGGSIYYINNVGNTIYYGEQSSVVRANPYKGYVFLYWSDGLKSAERTEYNVTSDMVLTAYFGYSATYKVNGHGSIKGETYQAVKSSEDFLQVEAVPDEGYAFGGWSDLQVQNLRQDTNAERCIEHIAYFEPIVKTFSFDYGIASGMPMESAVTINRENIILDGYPMPTLSGYTFEGWYADSEYKLKVINGDGRYMLGYYGFALETDTLYARWKPADDNEQTFKILLVFVNELEATLYATLPEEYGGDGLERDVHHVMSTIDREFCAFERELMSRYLSEWLFSITAIEVDAYFTVNAVSEKYIHYTKGQSECYSIATSDLPEMTFLYTKYNSILTVFGTNDYDGVMANRGVAGTAGLKYGEIFLENIYLPYMVSHIRLQDLLIMIKTENRKGESFIKTFIHEFIHTIEQAYPEGDIMSYHRSFYNYNSVHGYHPMIANRLYLLGEIEYNGEVGGFPNNFWAEESYKMLNLNWHQWRPFIK